MELEIAAHEVGFCTRAELKDALHLLEVRIESLRGDLKAVEGKLMRWTLTCVLGQTAVMAGAVYFAITHLHP